MLKKIVYTLFFIGSLNCLSQTNLGTSGLGGNSKETTSLFSGMKAQTYHTNFKDKDKNIEGSPYLFSQWNKKATIWFGDRTFVIDGVNYNLEDERFEVKLNNDSIFVLSPENNELKQISIDLLVFKPFHSSELNSDVFYEVLLDESNFELLSMYKLKITPGSVDPLTKEYLTPKQYSSEKEFYLRTVSDEKIKPIKLKKSGVLKLIKSDYTSQVKSFAKKQHLKYNKIADVQKILSYYFSIKS
ncbi:hypothetical protein PK35_12580 [Tamlana nanhaiensis]|uniref:Uncharacterized protein n=1 Tax=Neotamlana nanhaiensis TaxID=1382798 RepID=A0A0D7VYQ9_9FLAO|nr:hypothetical protein [Tamlana nanhaiensis]KJD31976.1 hypothetical protein PK35_12580 [Tamlana nanhaiensis]